MAHKANPNSPPALDHSWFGNLRYDAIAGFFVFLIAMPLCLAIAKASGFPPVAGIWTAVIGGVLCTLLSNAELTIKGPAAGLIVIVAGAVAELGNEFGAGLADTDKALIGYRLALGIGVTAGVIQILFGLLKAGRLADFFPLTPVHGLLASIGVIIIAKQSYEVLGVSPTKGAEPLHLLLELPQKAIDMNPEIVIIGLVGLMILFSLPLLATKLPWLKKVPGPLVVLAVAIGLGFVFDLEHQHTYASGKYTVGPHYLVTIPHVLEHPWEAFAFPDFRGLATAKGLQYLLLFTLIGSLESLLAAKAVELLDPWKRKTNFNRDLLAIGVANTLSAAIGGLPMISEIVRSRANIDNGGRTRFSNLFHGLFLLLFVLMFPDLIHHIPLAALGAMLVYTGFRLASPKEFVNSYKLGRGQFVVFIATIVTTLATDLLIGIAAGISLKIVLHIWNGTPITGMLKSDLVIVPQGDDAVNIIVRKAAVFSNWIGLRSEIVKQSQDRSTITLDLSETRLVDHTVMEKLHELEQELEPNGKHLSVIGLEGHQPVSNHPMATRKKLILANAGPNAV